MTTLVKDNGKATVYTKGSPEKILSMCTSALINGKTEPLTEALRKKLDEQIAAFQKQAKRVLGFAHKQTEIPKDCAAERAQIESDLIFDGFSAIADPLRKEVYDAVLQSRSAGVDIKILTGDNIVTNFTCWMPTMPPTKRTSLKNWMTRRSATFCRAFALSPAVRRPSK